MSNCQIRNIPLKYLPENTQWGHNFSWEIRTVTAAGATAAPSSASPKHPSYEHKVKEINKVIKVKNDPFLSSDKTVMGQEFLKLHCPHPANVEFAPYCQTPWRRLGSSTHTHPEGARSPWYLPRAVQGILLSAQSCGEANRPVNTRSFGTLPNTRVGPHWRHLNFGPMISSVLARERFAGINCFLELEPYIPANIFTSC